MSDLQQELAALVREKIAERIEQAFGISRAELADAFSVKVRGPEYMEDDRERWLPTVHLGFSNKDPYEDLPYFGVELTVGYPLSEFHDRGGDLKSLFQAIRQQNKTVWAGLQEYIWDDVSFTVKAGPDLRKVEEDVNTRLSIIFGENARDRIAVSALSGRNALEVQVNGNMPEGERRSAAFIINRALQELPERPAIRVKGYFPEMTRRFDL